MYISERIELPNLRHESPLAMHNNGFVFFLNILDCLDAHSTVLCPTGPTVLDGEEATEPMRREVDSCVQDSAACRFMVHSGRACTIR